MKKQDVLVHVISPILIGLLIYYFSAHFNVRGIIRNQLPDGLWAYSLSSSILIIWNREIKFSWFVAIFILFLSFETLQYCHVINGVGDVMDVIVYISFSGLALVLNGILKPKIIKNEFT